MRNCLYCDKPLKGNLLKKFCARSCRQEYNKELKNIVDAQTTDLHATLKKNRLLLRSLLGQTKEKVIVEKSRLKEVGFSFTYVSRMQTTQTGTTCYCCYDYGYCLLEDGRYLIIRIEDK